MNTPINIPLTIPVINKIISSLEVDNDLIVGCNDNMDIRMSATLMLNNSIKSFLVMYRENTSDYILQNSDMISKYLIDIDNLLNFIYTEPANQGVSDANTTK